MKKIDHIAINVGDINEAVEWYVNKTGGDVLYHDETWAMIQTKNVKIALTIKQEHPPHVAIEVDPNDYPEDLFRMHRDGSKYVYKRDPWGNFIELISYPTPNLL